MTDNRLVESWTWFAFASLTFVWRCISRYIRLGGWRYFELEDLIMLVTFGFYTNVIVWVNIQTKHPFTNILPSTGTAGMSQAEIDDRVYGSKITFAIESSMLMTQWGCKVCMCLLFHKLTSGLKQQQLVKFILGYVISGWVVTEIFFFGIWCRPFLNYFRVFDDNNLQCETSGKHLIMSYVFNLSSDLLMLCVPIPLFLQSQLAWKKKITMTGIFSLGIFVIISATLNRYYCFAHPDSILWIFWYVREASTAVIVTNIPHSYALLRKILNLEAFGTIFSGAPWSKRTNPSKSVRSAEQKNLNRGKLGVRISSRESVENLAPHDPLPLKIWQRNEYSIDDIHASEAQWGETEMKAIQRGEIGTKSTIVGNLSEEHSKE